jgi:hypothetical protein
MNTSLPGNQPPANQRITSLDRWELSKLDFYSAPATIGCEKQTHIIRWLISPSLNWIRSGGEALSEHKEGFDPGRNVLARLATVRFGADPSLRTVNLGAAIARSF